jgi:hypothetical protein
MAGQTPSRRALMQTIDPSRARAHQVDSFADAAPSPRLILQFPFGLNEGTDAQPGECVEGYNFDLAAFRTALIPRAPFDLKGTATNGGALTGLLQLVKRDNTETTLTVNGNKVYLWDGASTFTSKATVTSAALLRGEYWSLGEYLVITDLNLNNVVATWDGTTYGAMTHTGIAGNLFAKFAICHLNRMWLFNITIGTTAYPHMILACKFEDPTNWDSSTRGGATTVGGGTFATGLEAFFLLVPDLKAINGVCLFQNTLVMSTDKGRMWQLQGTSAKDFQFVDFIDTAPAIGVETVISIGNDVIFPRQGQAIAMLFATQAFGSALQAELARWIMTQLSGVTVFNQIVYDVTNQRVLFFVNGKVLVLYKEILAQDRGALHVGPSPWGVYLTQDTASFNTLAAKYMLRPGTAIYSVFFGDSTGRIFDLYGTNTSGDAGSTNSTVPVLRKSRHIGVEILNPWPFVEENITGHVRYRRIVATNVTVSFDWDDEYNTTQNVIALKGPPANDPSPYFGGSFYYTGTSYYNQGFSATKRMASMNIDPGGKGPGFFCSLSANCGPPFQIDQLELD